MNITQIAGKALPKLCKMEKGFWEALQNKDFQGSWNVYRRDLFAAAVASVSKPVETCAGYERAFRLLDRTYRAHFSVGVATEGATAIALGVVKFFHGDDEDQPFYTIYFDDEGHFGLDARELDRATLSSAELLCDLFEGVAEEAGKRYLLIA